MDESIEKIRMRKAKSLYVHIPFCKHICTYCDFPKVLLKTGFSTSYVPALLAEDQRYASYSFDTIFLGGGTPSSLPLNQIDFLLSSLVERHGHPKEFTIECNPEDVNDDLLRILVKNGINRISLGAQTTNDALLMELGRHHKFVDVTRAVELIKSYGINNVSLDFIYGFDGQTLDDIKNDLKAVQTLDIPHVSFYALQVESHTMFALKHPDDPDSDFLADCYNLIVEELKSIGLFRYEISNFAKPGYQSRHNLCYWHSDPYGAIGMGSTSYECGKRERRTMNIEKYMNGDFVFETIDETLKEEEFDFLMLNLRLEEGFKLAEFKRRFGHDFLDSYKSNLENVRSFLLIDGDSARVKPENLYILDSILVDLLHF